MNDKEIKRMLTLTMAIDTFGPEAQLKMAVEEMSELTKAICKLWRCEEGSLARKEAIEGIREEAADVRIMLDQLGILFGDTEAIEEKKLERLRNRINEYRREESK